jgi:hypothetical protein
MNHDERMSLHPFFSKPLRKDPSRKTETGINVAQKAAHLNPNDLQFRPSRPPMTLTV